jgi:hypothetical protein
VRRHAAAAAVGGTAPPVLPGTARGTAGAVRRALARADAALRAAPPHARAGRAAAVERLRHALARAPGAAGERALASASQIADDDAWLAALAAAADALGPPHPGDDSAAAYRLAVLVVLLPHAPPP